MDDLQQHDPYRASDLAGLAGVLVFELDAVTLQRDLSSGIALLHLSLTRDP